VSPDAPKLIISSARKFWLQDFQEGGRTPDRVASLLHRAADNIAALEGGQILDIVMDTGSYYHVSALGVLYEPPSPGGPSPSAVSHFSLVAASREGRVMVAELMREVANAIDGLGAIEVEGIVMHTTDDIDGLGRGPWITVYYRAKID
jgi:hypothetical protein